MIRGRRRAAPTIVGQAVVLVGLGSGAIMAGSRPVDRDDPAITVQGVAATVTTARFEASVQATAR